MYCFKKLKYAKGQSAVEFMLLIPVLVFAILIAFQMFSIIYTSLVNQAAARFEVFRKTNNYRGLSVKASFREAQDPIFPGLESFSPTFRSTNIRGNVQQKRESTKPYFAAMVEEPRGSGRFPVRTIQTNKSVKVEIKSRFGICEVAKGVCK